MAIILGAGHARIAIIQEINFLQAEVPGSTAQFGLPHSGDGLIALHVFSIHSAYLSACSADQIGVVAFPCIQGQGSAQPERFVIGMGQHCQQGLGH
jgi:hypothetical protein